MKKISNKIIKSLIGIAKDSMIKVANVSIHSTIIQYQI